MLQFVLAAANTMMALLSLATVIYSLTVKEKVSKLMIVMLLLYVITAIHLWTSPN
ncbi:MAG: hypothetical protein QXL01_07545 [Thermoplasmatales archaeon]